MRRYSLGLVGLAVIAGVGMPGPLSAIDLSVKAFIPGIVVQPGRSNLYDVALSPDGSKLYGAYWTDTASDPIGVYSTADYSLLGSMSYGMCHGGVAVSQDGRYVYAPSYYQGDVSRFDLQNGNSRAGLNAGDWPASVGLSPDGATLVVASGSDGHDFVDNNEALNVYNVSGGGFSTLASVTLPDEVEATRKISISSDSRFAYLGTSPRQSANGRIYEVSLTQPYGITRYVDCPGSDQLSAAVTNGSRVFVGDMLQNKIWSVGLATFSDLHSIDLAFTPVALAMLPDERHLLVGSYVNGDGNDSAVYVVDTLTDSIVASIDQLSDRIESIAVSPDGRTAYLAETGGITVLTIVPEPSALILLCASATCLSAFVWRRQRAA